MSELFYYVASTLDGFIAHEDGSFEGFQWDDEVVSDFMSDLESFGTVLMGRKTYEVGLREGKTSPYPSMRQIVFSKTLKESPDEAVEVIDDNIIEFVETLKANTTKPVWLCGGSEIASLLMTAGLIDRIVVKLNPVVFGQGIKLFDALVQPVSMQLENTKKYDCGIILLTYRVI